MATRLITLATFPSTALAMLAHNVLADAGIDSEVTEGNTSWAFSGLLGEVKLIVAEDDAERAGDVLDEQARLFGEEPVEHEIEPESQEDSDATQETDDYQPADYAPHSDDPAWTCRGCGARVAEDANQCWSCGTSKRGEANPYFARPIESAAKVSSASRPELPADVLDDLVTRAWRASMIGILLFPPLVTFYSAWLLLRAAGTGAKFDARQNRRFMIALAINLIVGGLSSLFWWEFVGVPVFLE